jgi:tetratricopeptide (TPR) repeat protein
MVQEGRTDEALALYRQMIEAEPANHSYRERLAAIFLESAQVSEAADEFRTIALAHLEAGRLEPAGVYAAKAAELDADSPAQVRLECDLAEASGDSSRLGELMERLARSEHQAGRHELSLEAARKAQAAGRGGLDLLVAKGLLALKRYPEARAAFLKLLEAAPGDESLLEPLLLLDEQTKDWPAAVERVTALLALRPDDAVLLNRSARILQQAGKTAEAAQTYLKLAGAALKEGKLEVVLNHFASILAFQPHNADILKKKAEVLFKMGRKAETIAAYKDLEKSLVHHKMTEDARKVAMLINKIQSLPEIPTKGTLH